MAPAIASSPRQCRAPAMATAARITPHSAREYSDVAAVAARITASQIAVRTRGRSTSASAKYSVSGSPQACVAARCASLVRRWTLNATSAPATRPAAADPVQRRATNQALQAVNTRPAASSTLKRSAGEAPAQAAGAATIAGAMSGSEYASVLRSGAKMLPSKIPAGFVPIACAIHGTIHAFNCASAW